MARLGFNDFAHMQARKLQGIKLGRGDLAWAGCILYQVGSARSGHSPIWPTDHEAVLSEGSRPICHSDATLVHSLGGSTQGGRCLELSSVSMRVH